MKASDHIEQKFVSRNAIPNLFSTQFRENRRLVFTNGCFDILHKGHIHLLASAKSLGDILIVGLNSDDSVRRLKGDKRPIQDEKTRAEALASLEYVDYVIPFNEDTPMELLQLLKPDLLVKGGDYKIADIVGYDFVRTYGGKVQTIQFLEGFSSTSIIDIIK